MKRRLVGAMAALVLAATVTACSSSSSSDSAPAVERTTTTAAGPTTTEPTSTTGDLSDTTTTGAPTTTEAEAITALPPCQELLQQYADAFVPDDLLPVAQLFRQWAPFMPVEVGAASQRLAQAYEAAQGDLANLDMADQDLSDDAQVFSDWTNAGCPAR